MDKLENLKEDFISAVEELLEKANLNEEDILVIGGSTSEIIGETIGSASVPDIGVELINSIMPIIKRENIFLAVQCCEHLNRALIIEERCAKKYGLTPVTVVPHPKAGGSLSSAYYRALDNPVVVEEIQADAGLDIGDTFIGMHLKRVAVPVRLSIKNIGSAHLTAARVRPKLIGGERAKYE